MNRTVNFWSWTHSRFCMHMHIILNIGGWNSVCLVNESEFYSVKNVLSFVPALKILFSNLQPDHKHPTHTHTHSNYFTQKTSLKINFKTIFHFPLHDLPHGMVDISKITVFFYLSWTQGLARLNQLLAKSREVKSTRTHEVVRECGCSQIFFFQKIELLKPNQ